MLGMRMTANHIRTLLRRQEGQALAEYGLLIVLIVLGLVVAVTFFRDQLVSVFQRMGNALR